MNLDDAVALTETGQRAAVGHMMQNKTFFAKCRAHLPPEAFVDSRHRDFVSKLYAYHDELGRPPTFAEYEQHAQRDAVSKAKETYDFKLLYQECLAAAAQVKLDVLTSEMSFWLQTVIVRDALNRGTDMFNRGEVQQAADVIASAQKHANGFVVSDPDADLRERRDERRKEMMAWTRAMRARTAFIDKCLEPIISLTPGLIAVGAPSGTGKSTCVANLLASFWLNDQRRAFLMSGEETTFNALGNIACCLMKADYLAFRNDPMGCPGARQIEAKIAELEERIIVKSKDLGDIQVMKAEVERAVEAKAGVIVVDYLQFCVRDSQNPRASEFEVSRQLAAFLAEVAERANIPVVLMLQLSNSNQKMQFSERTFGNKSAFRHFTEAIELMADKVNRVTWFKSWKSRQKVAANIDMPMRWDMGRLEALPDQDVKRLIELKRMRDEA